MITVPQIAASVLWILGLGIILASWSMAYYHAQYRDIRVITLLGERRFDALVTFGLFLAFLGWAAVDSRFWASVVWLLLAAIALLRFIFVLRWPALST